MLGAVGVVGLISVFIWNIIGFVRNLNVARSTGLSYVCMPVYEPTPLWRLSKPFHQAIISFLFPSWLLQRWPNVVFWYDDWRFSARHSAHARLGDVFLIVSPGGVLVEVADAQTVAYVLSKGQGAFVKPAWIYDGAMIFGTNIVAANGRTWRRHRKVIATQFTEKVHQMAWREALFLATSTLPRRTSAASPSAATDPTATVVEDIWPNLTRLGLGVITGAAFGLPDRGDQKTEPVPSNHPPSGLAAQQTARFPSALDEVITNVVKLIVIPRSLLKYGPSSWRRLAASFDEVGSILHEIMDVKIQQTSDGETVQGDMLSGIIDSGILSSEPGDHTSAVGLSKSEVLGNTYMLALAGSRTTSDTLLYAFILLAMHPDVQEWVREEVDGVVAFEDENPLNWPYHALFPKLIAPLCVMMETLRLYPPVGPLPKWNLNTPQHLPMTGNRQIFLPANTLVILDLNALHVDPRHWGPQPAAFQPQNWDKRCPRQWPLPTATDVTEDDGSSLRTPIEGSFLPFGLGSRACPGKRFAQSEFVAVVSAVLRRWRVELAPRDGDTWHATQQKVATILEESVSNPTLMPQEGVELKFVPREHRSR